jgi:hypothetical protein
VLRFTSSQFGDAEMTLPTGFMTHDLGGKPAAGLSQPKLCRQAR